MRTPVEKAIWFIESHFSRDVTLDDLARVCGLSRFQMSRLFSYATGKTVTGYVRGRRLSEAARALADGAPTFWLSPLWRAMARTRLSPAPFATSSALARPNCARAAAWRAFN